MPYHRSAAALRSQALAAVLLALPGTAGAQDSTSADWRADWAVADGFTLRRDAEGFRFPTSIAFVPEPGAAPDDPLYFVAELQGTIKVVTNDRHVHTFATAVMPLPRDTLPGSKAETGLAGLCIDSRLGDVFATYAYRDSAGVLRNGMARFETKPRHFARMPTRIRSASPWCAAGSSSPTTAPRSTGSSRSRPAETTDGTDPISPSA